MVMGSTIIHEDVFREIVRLLLEEMEEVYVYEPKGPLAPFLGDKAVKPIIHVHRKKNNPAANNPAAEEDPAEASAMEPLEDLELQPETVEIEVKLALVYGASIPQTVATIRKEIAERIQRYTGYTTEKVDVYITRIIRFEQERSELFNESETTGDHKDESDKQPGLNG